ncbi:MAG: hypothetical protein ACODAJ_12320 [Planctomycetota bacterium]
MTLEVAPSGPTFEGTLTAARLKPTFAYQLKLNGRPALLFGDEGDDQANERLGYAGRWWARQTRLDDGAVVRQWRSSDEEYQGWKARGFQDAEHRVVFEGYLLFDYLVTDADGAARLDIALDSSFHVLFRTDQREPRPHDSPPTAHTVVARADSPWYDADLPPQTVELYAEWEPTRALPGQCRLPPGDYRCQLFLTEESFHERSLDAGSWATVLAAPDLAFTIG